MSCGHTLRRRLVFANQDVALKVISGDNPVTVASIAQRAEIKDADRLVDMSQVGTTPTMIS